MLGRFTLLPAGQTFKGDTSGMAVIDRSALSVAVARAAAPLTPVGSFNPFYRSGALVQDGITASYWSENGGEPNSPATSAIMGEPALQFVHNQSRHYRSTYSRPAGSFGIVMVVATSPDEANTFPSLLFGVGPSEQAVLHARYEGGTIRFLADNNDAHGRIDTGLGGGLHVLAFSYDASTGVGAVVRSDGVQTDARFAQYPVSGSPWNVGGWIDGYGFAGKIGQVLIFDRQLHAGDALPLTQNLLSVMRAEYA